MKKIAFIIIRYGADVNGGAEVHCRMLAERLASCYDVEVLTTTTRVFNAPEQDYPEGMSVENGVTIRRFKPQPVDAENYKVYKQQLRKARRVRYHLARLGLLRLISAVHPAWTAGSKTGMRYLESQADHTPSMLRFIDAHRDDYSALFFMNFYFSQAVLGSVIAPEKSILIPLAHPDKTLYISVNAPMFTRVRHIAFNTGAEMRMCRKIFGSSMSPCSVVGSGIEQVPPAPWEEVKARYSLPDEYALYLGRVTRGKINDLIPEFIRYRQQLNPAARLVMVGGLDPDIQHPEDPGILFTGFVSDAEKSAIIRHATVMVNPSHMESLSLLMLEAMAEQVPVLVNGRSEVMKGHCKLSGAALYYNSAKDFRRKLHRLLTNPELRRELGAQGPEYVRRNYDWEVIIGKLRALVESI